MEWLLCVIIHMRRTFPVAIDPPSLLPFLPFLGERGHDTFYLSDHMFKNQSLVFSLIGRETILVVCGLLFTD